MGRGFFSVESLGGVFALVVDTDKDRRNLVAGILRYCGALVAPVETPQAASAIMRLLKPDVVVVDVSDPDDGAFEFIHALRTLPPDEGGTVATIALGAAERSDERARAYGFDAHLGRPLDAWRLCELVSDLLAR